jgi:iron complex outermembrane receptor protein
VAWLTTAPPATARAFGEATLNFTSDFRGIAGLRYTHDELEYDSPPRLDLGDHGQRHPAGHRSSGSVDEDGWSGRLGVQYDLSDAVTTYLTYSRGYKGPAYNVFFNMQPRDTEALKPETSNTGRRVSRPPAGTTG